MGKYLEGTLLKDGGLFAFMMGMNIEIPAYGVPTESIEIALEEGINEAKNNGSCYLFIDEVPNYHDGGTENDVEWGSSLPEYAETAWKIEYKQDDENEDGLYSITKIIKEKTYIPVSGEKEYTGGGCWIGEGKTSDGNFFLICYDERSVGIFDADTKDGVDNDFMENHTVHLFVDDSPEANEFIRKFEEITGENKAETEIEKLKDETEKLKEEIENLKRKNKALSRTLVSILDAKKESCSDGNVSAEDFVRMMIAEEDVAVDDEEDGIWWDDYCDGEFLVTWKGITAKMGNNSNWAKLWSDLAKDYEVYRW